MYVDMLSHRASDRRIRARKLWSAHVVGRWKRWRPALLAMVAIAAIVLGMIGYVRAYRHDPLSDSVYRTLQLFTLEGAVPDQSNIFLEFARYLAPLVIGYAALAAVLALYRDQLNRLWIRRLRNHVVVAGLGSAGFRVARSFADAGWQVVVVEADVNNVAIRGCKERGIRVLVGDASDHHILREAGVGRAVLLVVVCGGDGLNMDIASAARGISAEHRDHILTAIVEFEDFELWYVMKAQAFVDRRESTFRIELVNIYALAADLLLDEHPPFVAEETGDHHVLVVGQGDVAQSLIMGVLGRWLNVERAPGERLRVTIAGPESPLAYDALVERHPGIVGLPGVHVEPWEIDMASAGIMASAPADVNRIYVAMTSDTKALAVALNLREQTGLWREVPIVVTVEDRDAGIGRTVNRVEPALDGIEAFGWLSDSLRPESLLGHTATETIARLGHQLHCDEQRRLGVTVRDDPSLVPWEQLHRTLREANRMWADDISDKLIRLSCVVAPAPLANPDGQAFCFTEEEVELLAPLEHDRWCVDMKRMGFMRGPRDECHHPLIDVSFEALPEPNREEDRHHVRSIPLVLTRAGFTIRRVR